MAGYAASRRSRAESSIFCGASCWSEPGLEADGANVFEIAGTRAVCKAIEDVEELLIAGEGTRGCGRWMGLGANEALDGRNRESARRAAVVRRGCA